MVTPPFLVYANMMTIGCSRPTTRPSCATTFWDVVNDIILQHKATENMLRAAKTQDELFSLVARLARNLLG